MHVPLATRARESAYFTGGYRTNHSILVRDCRTFFLICPPCTSGVRIHRVAVFMNQVAMQTMGEEVGRFRTLA